MYIIKNIVIKSAVALFAGVASTIGARLGDVIWNSCISNKVCEKYETSIIQ